MLKIKKGVQPPIIYLVAAVANASEWLGKTFTITSGADGKHSEWSGHYQLRAIDARKDITSNDIMAIKDEIKHLMGVSLTRILVKREDTGTSNEHIHIQFK